MSSKNVLDTTVHHEFAQVLSDKSKIELILKAAEYGKQNDDRIETDLKNRLLALEAYAQSIEQKADMLQDFEKGQLEEMFNQFLQSAGIPAILSAISVNVNGQAVSLQSVLTQLLNRDQVYREEFSRDGDGFVTSNNITLQDGYSFIMNYVRTDLAPAEGASVGDIRFDGQGVVRSFPVTESITFRPVKQTVELYGQSFDATARHDLIDRTRIMYDITSLLEAATPISPTVPDYNGNGYTDPNAPAIEPIVEPTPEPEVMPEPTPEPEAPTAEPVPEEPTPEPTV